LISLPLVKITIKDRLIRMLRLNGMEILSGVKDDTELYIELFGEENVRKRRFCNVSAGGYYGFGAGLRHPCWTNVDFNRSWKATSYRPSYPEYVSGYDIAYDALTGEKFPFDDNSILLVNCRYALGHITDEAALNMFKGIHCALVSGGLLRIVTPNVDLDYNAYLSGDRKFFYWHKDDVSIEQAFLFHIAATASTLFYDCGNTKINDEEFSTIINSKPKPEALDYFISRCDPDIHLSNRSLKRNWWNPDKLEFTLKKAGFKNIQLSARGQSSSPVLRNLRHFDTDYNEVMLYMEAVK